MATVEPIRNKKDIQKVEKIFIKQIYNLIPIEKIQTSYNLDNIIEFLTLFDNY